MALIACPQCGNPVSTRASVCPRCAVSFSVQSGNTADVSSGSQRAGWTPAMLACAFTLGAVLFGVFVFKVTMPGAAKPWFSFSAGKPRPTRDQWMERAPILGNFKRAGKIYCKKADLFAAVGEPERTQSSGENVFLYWKCSDGWIQVSAHGLNYRAAGMIMGEINSY